MMGVSVAVDAGVDASSNTGFELERQKRIRVENWKSVSIYSQVSIYHPPRCPNKPSLVKRGRRQKSSTLLTDWYTTSR